MDDELALYMDVHTHDFRQAKLGHLPGVPVSVERRRDSCDIQPNAYWPIQNTDTSKKPKRANRTKPVKKSLWSAQYFLLQVTDWSQTNLTLE
ncbi:hypothetical protein [Shewanella sp. GXUN23E]|uniref:hypothetical protein n=1 Tax=Shewanella sp. GXUN23E TaxID=3422498 RepID=UPI003D7ED02B